MVDRLREPQTICCDFAKHETRRDKPVLAIEANVASEFPPKLVGFVDHPKLGAQIIIERTPLSSISPHKMIEDMRPFFSSRAHRLRIVWIPDGGTTPGPLYKYAGTYFRNDLRSAMEGHPIKAWHVYVSGVEL